MLGSVHIDSLWNSAEGEELCFLIALLFYKESIKGTPTSSRTESLSSGACCSAELHVVAGSAS